MRLPGQQGPGPGGGRAGDLDATKRRRPCMIIAGASVWASMAHVTQRLNIPFSSS